MADEEDEEEKKEDEAAEDEDSEGGDGEDGEEGEGEDGGGGKNKLFIIIGAVVLLLVGGGAGAYFMGFLDPLLGGGEAEMVPLLDDHGEPVLDDHGEPVMVPKEGDAHGDDHEGGHGDEHAEDGHGDEHGDGHGDGHGEEGGGSNFLAIPTMLVNLNSDDGVPRYLRLTVQLELAKASEVGKVEAVMPRVVDQFQTYLRELRVKDLRGSAGIYRLQMELLWRVNQAAAPVEVKDVLFQEILIQ